VGTDDLADAISQARSQLQRLLSRVRRAAPHSAREAVIQALTEGLRALPIPLVGSFLANLVSDTLKPENQGPGLDDLLSRLTDMAESDRHFEDGLTSLGTDMGELRDDLRAIREAQVGTAFTFTRAKSLDQWPVFDNQVSGLLINRRGGLVVLDEVYIDVEGCEPITEINLTIPAAPLETIRLKAELAPDRIVYPLFAINHEEPHQFAQGLGAERLEISLSSRHNARYSFRLRLAYYDDATGQDRELTWPPEDKPAIVSAFACAPGWGRGPELLNRSAVISNAEARLSVFAVWLDHDGDPSILDSLGIPEWITQDFMLRSFADVMSQWVASLPDATPGLKAAVSSIATTAAHRNS
jgi:hypothetical protein